MKPFPMRPTLETDPGSGRPFQKRELPDAEFGLRMSGQGA